MNLNNPPQLPDRFPTKQGLKQIRYKANQKGKFHSQTDFQQNKDWNKHYFIPINQNPFLPDRFPTKQGLKLNNQELWKRQ